MNQNSSVRKLVHCGVVAAIYVVLCLALQPLSYGAVQVRVAEALCLLPVFGAEYIVCVVLGCFLANLLGSPFVLDWIFGTLATLLAAIWTSKVKNRWLAPLPPVVCNAVIVGAEIAYFATLDGAAFWPAYAFNAFTVGLGEAVACYVLGSLLLRALVPVLAAHRTDPNAYLYEDAAPRKAALADTERLPAVVLNKAGYEVAPDLFLEEFAKREAVDQASGEDDAASLRTAVESRDLHDGFLLYGYIYDADELRALAEDTLDVEKIEFVTDGERCPVYYIELK